MTDLNDHINLNKDLTYFIACSGGLDSIVLLHLLKEEDLDVHAIHMNYGLRNDESDHDEDFVRSVCDRLNIPLEIRRSDLYRSETKGINIQLAARNERYKWFNEILKKSDSHRVVLGHHLDDQIETFYLNLARNSGVLGLCAMLPEHNGIVRPLLSFGKQELNQYALEKGISWREDSSNAENKYRRNKLRNLILPELYSKIPDLQESVLLLINKMQELHLDLESRCESLVIQARSSQFISDNDLQDLNELELIEFFRQLGLTYNEHLEILKMEKTGGIIKSNNPEFDLIARERDGYSLINTRNTPSSQFHVEEADELPTSFSKEEIFLDADKLDGELELRNWEIGDRIKPIGLGGSKLVSKVIKEGKLSTKEKIRCFVLTDRKEILWVPGLSVGRTALADNTTQKIIKVTLSPQEPQV